MTYVRTTCALSCVLLIAGCGTTAQSTVDFPATRENGTYTGVVSALFYERDLQTRIDFENDTFTWLNADWVHATNAPRPLHSCQNSSPYFCGKIIGSQQIIAIPKDNLPDQWSYEGLSYRVISGVGANDCNHDYLIRVEKDEYLYIVIRYSKSYGLKEILLSTDSQPLESDTSTVYPSFNSDYFFTEPGVWADGNCSE